MFPAFASCLGIVRRWHTSRHRQIGSSRNFENSGCGTWALTEQDLSRLESFHRHQFRRVLRIHYPAHISNFALYAQCHTELLRQWVSTARWRLFGHILRRSAGLPAQTTMLRYFNAPSDSPPFLDLTPTCLPTVLARDVQSIHLQL
uniref:AlNc14C120G6633 protein n=1 Tax=Albugo laibachii Nc14 TaxID=890382 RepID=F0WJA4_9STRA|nr:AlNc14C120G6633 [Albugo laibachii Nc14]|eukprot:CCA21351.1 AlNc14C120G6633 [Albugo laibachii Nc14]